MVLVLGIVGLLLALIEELMANGKSLVGWAVLALAIAVIELAGGFRVSFG